MIKIAKVNFETKTGKKTEVLFTQFYDDDATEVGGYGNYACGFMNIHKTHLGKAIEIKTKEIEKTDFTEETLRSLAKAL
jgi:hypothetical protein